PPAPTPAAPRPALHKKSGAVSRVAPGTNAEDEAFIPPCALQKRIPHRAAKDSNPPPPAQPRPLSTPTTPTRLLRPRLRNLIDLLLPLCDFHPHSRPSFVIQAARPAEQLAISRMRPAKHPVSQESLDEEDEQVFKEEAQAEELDAQLAKGKKGKGKQSDAKGPFKSGLIPDEAKQRAFAIHAAFEKQIQDLAAEISKALQLLFSLVGEASPQEWTKIVSTERDKYCKAKLGDKWEDPDAVATLFEPFMAWHCVDYLDKSATQIVLWKE
ncbi:hypothetical protein DXG01_012557, partial [Tephrocybe rancida]